MRTVVHFDRRKRIILIVAPLVSIHMRHEELETSNVPGGPSNDVHRSRGVIAPIGIRLVLFDGGIRLKVILVVIPDQILTVDDRFERFLACGS